MKAQALAAAALIALGACTLPGAQDSAPTQPAFKTESFAARVSGYRNVTVATKGPAGAVAGARCTLSSDDLTYPEIVTPAKIALPKVKGKPAPLFVRCTAPGFTAAERYDAAVDGRAPLLPTPVGLVVAGVGYAAAEASDRWIHYARRGKLTVDLKPAP
ncbi:hypothetical protein LPB142_06885 [Rhodobacter xanthinilyticus]|uniref:Lipoprotein n=1 Tax=Rhodobacter xanthinilyticus TaxID=1850250 RepID=A0A1D9MB15_9RHOB|nr:hypothetical protein [Rhodobacter xanthinilyticus]AOZ69085.1 hypothetical protein LPB142_06885 [Rhodobacter xanthinilyticus]